VKNYFPFSVIKHLKLFCPSFALIEAWLLGEVPLFCWPISTFEIGVFLFFFALYVPYEMVDGNGW
jgi:hypothetical protein